MPGRHYTPPEIAAGALLGRTIGAEAASEQLRRETGRPYDVRLIRKWMAETPEPPIEQSDWQRLADLALAKATSMVASGRMTAVQVATIAGIAARNARAEPMPAERPEDPVADALDAFLAWAIEARPDLVKHYGSPEHTVSALLRAILRRERMREWAWEMAGLPYEVKDASYGEL